MRVEEAAHVLAVPRTVGRTELRSAYKAAAFSAHPDRGGDRREFELVTRAYKVLARLQDPREPAQRTLADVQKERASTDQRGRASSKQLDAPKQDHDAPPRDAAASFNARFVKTKDADDDGLGDWLGRAVPEKQRPPEAVKFEHFHDTFRRLADSRCRAVVPKKVDLLPAGCGLGAKSLGGKSVTFDSDSTLSSRSLQFADLRSAYPIDT
jgi:curved DNA-binding protein CbpA